MFNNDREEACVSNRSPLFTLALHQMRIKICYMCHQSTSSRIRIEDHEILQQNEGCMFTSNDILPQELETHRVNLDDMSSNLLRDFLHGSYAHT